MYFPKLTSENCLVVRKKAKLHYQNWVFIQGFVIIVEKNDIKNRIYVLECSRRKKERIERRKTSKI